MLENERPHGVGMTLGAHGELPGSGTHLMANLCAVRIMAVAALDESGIDTVPIWPRELGLFGSMAPETEFGLRLYEHEIDVGRFMRAVTRGTANSVGQVLRLGEVLRLQA